MGAQAAEPRPALVTPPCGGLARSQRRKRKNTRSLSIRKRCSRHSEAANNRNGAGRGWNGGSVRRSVGYTFSPPLGLGEGRAHAPSPPSPPRPAEGAQAGGGPAGTAESLTARSDRETTTPAPTAGSASKALRRAHQLSFFSPEGLPQRRTALPPQAAAENASTPFPAPASGGEATCTFTEWWVSSPWIYTFHSLVKP